MAQLVRKLAYGVFHLGQSQLSYLRIMGYGTTEEIKDQQHKRPTTESEPTTWGIIEGVVWWTGGKSLFLVSF